MTDYILQEVRDARAALAADFDYDIARIIAWAQAQEASERETCKQSSPTDNALHPTAGAVVPSESPAVSK